MFRIVVSRTAAGVLCLLPLFAAACGSGSASDGPSNGDDTASPDAATGTADAAIGSQDGGSSSFPDASAALPPFVSNIPGATSVDVGSPPTPNLVLLSVNFLQTMAGTDVFQQWLGEVANVGTTPVCYLQIDLTYESASGAAIVTPGTTYADADDYALSGLTEPVPCIPPGGVGSFYQNNIPAAAASTTDVTTIAVKFTSLNEPSIAPDPLAPTLSALVKSSSLGYSLAGTIAEPATSGAIYNVAYRAYPRDATGLVLGQLEATDLQTIEPGGSFAFTTQSVDSPFAQFRQYSDYIDGADPSGAMLPGPANEPFRAAAARRRAVQSATAARASLVRSLR